MHRLLLLQTAFERDGHSEHVLSGTEGTKPKGRISFYANKRFSYASNEILPFDQLGASVSAARRLLRNIGRTTHLPVIYAGWKPNPVGRVPATDGQQGLACYPAISLLLSYKGTRLVSCTRSGAFTLAKLRMTGLPRLCH